MKAEVMIRAASVGTGSLKIALNNMDWNADTLPDEIMTWAINKGLPPAKTLNWFTAKAEIAIDEINGA